MGFGHRVYRAEDPRARVLRATAKRLEAPRFEVAAALEQAALAELRERRPDRAIETNVEFWAAVILDFAEVPAKMMPAMFTCGRTAGWCAHILEQKNSEGSSARRPSTSGLRRAAPKRSRAGTRSRRVDAVAASITAFESAARGFAGLVRRIPGDRLGRARTRRVGSSVAGRPHLPLADHGEHLPADVAPSARTSRRRRSTTCGSRVRLERGSRGHRRARQTGRP